MPFARSDLAYVFVSQAHGGCGQPHRRPVEQGAPAKIWEERCPKCSDYLRNDPHWSATVSDIAETHDEALAREDFEKRGARDKDAIMTLALAKLAGVDPDLLPASLTQMVSGAKAHVPQTVNCPEGHPNAVDAKFCSACGRLIGEALPPVAAPTGGGAGGGGNVQVTVRHAESATVSPPEPPPAPKPPAEPERPPAPAQKPPAPVAVLPSNTKMRTLKAGELKIHAGNAGLDTEGTREQLLNRLIEHNNATKAANGG